MDRIIVFLAGLFFTIPSMAQIPCPGGLITNCASPHYYNATIGGTLTLAHNPNTLNVRDYGATGNGTTDDTAAIQAAATACPTAGCTLLFPPGYTFGVTGTTYLKSNTHVMGYGATIVALGPINPTPDSSFFQNIDYTATVLTDHDITIEGITIDSATSTRNVGHAIEMDFVSRAKVINVIGYGRGPTTTATGTYTAAGGVVTGLTLTSGGAGYVGTSAPNSVAFGGAGGSGATATVNMAGGVVTGFTQTGSGSGYTTGTYPLTLINATGDFIAMIGTSDTLIQGCSGFYYVNATYDHWWGVKNARVIGNYAIMDISAQAVNFNPEPSSGPYAGLTASDFVFSGNTIISTAPVSVPMQFEPLGAGTFVNNVSVTGNTFENIFLVMRRATTGASVTGNTFLNNAGGTAVIEAYPLLGETPDSISIVGNTIVNPSTPAPAVAVITMGATNSVVANNVIAGTGYYEAINTSSYTTTVFGNSFNPSAYGVIGTAWNSGTEMPKASYNQSFMLTGATITASGMPGYVQVPMINARNSDGSQLPILTAASGHFGLHWGAGGTLLATENANNSTITDTALWEIVLPPGYVAGDNITVNVWGYYTLGSGTIGTHTLTGTAYLVNDPGGVSGSNLIATAALPVSTTAGTLSFTITGTTLTPGAKVMLSLAMALQDTSGHNISGLLTNVDLQ